MLTERDAVRFWAKVALPDGFGCMLWLASRTRGYGAFYFDGRMRPAPRISLILAGHAVPGIGFEAAHNPGECHRRDCVAPDHLRWATAVENQADRVIDGTTNRGERCGNSKLTSDQVLEIRDLASSGVMQRELARSYAVSEPTISLILKRERWNHV